MEYEEENTDGLLRVLEVDAEGLEQFKSSLKRIGCSCHRWGGFPPWKHNLPKEKDRVVLLHKKGDENTLYLTHVIAVGDDEALPFLEDKTMVQMVDDCTWFVLTNIAGLIKVKGDDLEFLENEVINPYMPEEFISEDASDKLLVIFNALD